MKQKHLSYPYMIVVVCAVVPVSVVVRVLCTATKYKLGAVQISASEGLSRDELTDSQKQQLRQQLEEIGANSSKIRFPAGASCPVQITNKDIKEIVSFAHNIDNVEQLESIVHVWDDHMAKAIVDAISMFYSENRSCSFSYLNGKYAD